MYRRNDCNFQWVYMFGNKHVVAYKPGELMRAQMTREGDTHLTRSTGTSGLSVTCLRAFMRGFVCRVHGMAGVGAMLSDVPDPVDDLEAVQKQMVQMAQEPCADSQNVSLTVLATLELSDDTKDILIKHVLESWCQQKHVNANLLYFVQTFEKPTWAGAFIDAWADASQTFVCDACAERKVTCLTLYRTQRRTKRSTLPHVSMQMPVDLRCNMCFSLDRTYVTVPPSRHHLHQLHYSHQLHHSLSTRRKSVCTLTQPRRKPIVVRRYRHRPLVAALS